MENKDKTEKLKIVNYGCFSGINDKFHALKSCFAIVFGKTAC